MSPSSNSLELWMMPEMVLHDDYKLSQSRTIRLSSRLCSAHVMCFTIDSGEAVYRRSKVERISAWTSACLYLSIRLPLNRQYQALVCSCLTLLRLPSSWITTIWSALRYPWNRERLSMPRRGGAFCKVTSINSCTVLLLHTRTYVFRDYSSSSPRNSLKWCQYRIGANRRIYLQSYLKS